MSKGQISEGLIKKKKKKFPLGFTDRAEELGLYLVGNREPLMGVKSQRADERGHVIESPGVAVIGGVRIWNPGTRP